MQLHSGDKAPDFTLFTSEKEEVSLIDFLGKNVVILFYPQAFSGVCTEELCSVRDTLKDFEELEAQVVAISVDSVFTLEAFKEKNNYNFPLLSDFNKEVIEKYGVVHHDFAFGMKDVAKRAVFLLDKEGVIQYMEVLDNPGEMPKIEELKTALKEI